MEERKNYKWRVKNKEVSPLIFYFWLFIKLNE